MSMRATMPMSAMTGLTSVIRMPYARIPLGLTNETAILGFLAMGYSVMISTNVAVDFLMFVIFMRLARTAWVLIHAHANTVFMEMVENASTLTNAEMVVIHVAIMRFVVTL